MTWNDGKVTASPATHRERAAKGEKYEMIRQDTIRYD